MQINDEFISLFTFLGPILAEEDTDSEGDSGLLQEAAEIKNGTMQKETGDTGGIQPSSAHLMQQSDGPIKHSHERSEEIDLSFKKNCKLSQLLTHESALKYPP